MWLDPRKGSEWCAAGWTIREGHALCERASRGWVVAAWPEQVECAIWANGRPARQLSPPTSLAVPGLKDEVNRLAVVEWTTMPLAGHM